MDNGILGYSRYILGYESSWVQIRGNKSCRKPAYSVLQLMTSLRRFCADDMFKFANVNLDHLTETVSVVYGCVGDAV